MSKSFETWWKEGTSVEVPLYGEANARKAWDYQQAIIDKLIAAIQTHKNSFGTLGGHTHHQIILWAVLEEIE